jgi:hypothetical protein
MTTAILLLACVLLAGAVLTLLVAVRRLGARLEVWESGQRRLTGAGAPSSSSEGAPEVIEPPGDDTDGESGEFVITRLGREQDAPTVPTVEASMFADIMLREAVVKAASWAYAVRIGLSAANRNRVRFEMRREVKRVRKHRKVEEREAIREWRARRRAGVQDENAA